MRASLVVLLVAGCGGGSPALVEQPKSWADHVEAANEHEANAALHASVADQAENAPANFTCMDPVLNDQLTSGTERVTTWTPCIDVEWETEARHRGAANRELEKADREIDQANRLAARQRASCQGLSEAELEASPFADRAAIADVIPYARDDVRGARILLEPAPGRTAERTHRVIACHQARFDTLGQPGTYLGMDPTVVAGARVQVREVQGRIEVLVTSDDPTAGVVISGRAQDLTAPQTAER